MSRPSIFTNILLLLLLLFYHCSFFLCMHLLSFTGHLAQSYWCLFMLFAPHFSVCLHCGSSSPSIVAFTILSLLFCPLYNLSTVHSTLSSQSSLFPHSSVHITTTTALRWSLLDQLPQPNLLHTTAFNYTHFCAATALHTRHTFEMSVKQTSDRSYSHRCHKMNMLLCE